MATRTASRWCRHCEAQRLGQAPGANHILHLLLTLVTFGFWLPIWLLIALFGGGRYHCTHCGGQM